ncbi:hypothetical protein AB0K00_29550 [Dactylosporangium sp. NPDC049525]|uniref:hypothetical protein n=1 Tax=Dactylosporangium sp. NPDC049525 TaxID=3154730 RepID=UPI0034449437
MRAGRPGATRFPLPLSGWVRGGYAFLGTEYGGTWSPPSSQWTRLSVTFTTGPATTDVRVYVHGWYAQALFAADDLMLAGPDSRTTVPVPPADLAPSETTSHSVRLAPGSSHAYAVPAVDTAGESRPCTATGAGSPGATDLRTWPRTSPPASTPSR